MPNEPDENVQSSSQTQNTKQSRFKTFIGIGLMILFDVILPIAIYLILKRYLRETYALIISSIPPFIIVIIGFMRNRRVDILGTMLALSFIVTAIVVAFKDDPRIHLLRRSVVTGVIGTVFLITLIPIKIGSFKMRPIVFYFSKDMATGGSFGYSNSNELPGLTEDEPIADRWDRYWDSYPLFRRAFIVMTAVWGVGLLSEVPARVVVVYKVTPFEKAYFISQVITYSWLGVLILFNILYIRWVKKKGVTHVSNDEYENKT
jgi:hypothetical protein